MLRTDLGSDLGSMPGTEPESGLNMKIIEFDKLVKTASILLKIEYILQSFLQLNEFWNVEKRGSGSSSDNSYHGSGSWLSLTNDFILCQSLMTCLGVIEKVSCSFISIIPEEYSQSSISLIKDIQVRNDF